ncbi:head GIN domain-containing protein [Undibacterium griseum]|uniref:DUF2807 domain-containing protein n=1 Tax=Undibacterium griseum TaxID=2762295 RepID=A0ABR6YPN3_9BURK|nr:head GIN domain-containing protein [Undibacterium griseum]MBC3885857.1 DUF2807 domain-containing protein [Undibacterium griseum]
MKHILRTGVTLLALSVVLTAASALVIRAHAATVAASAAVAAGPSASGNAASGALASERREVEARIVNVVMSGPLDLLLRPGATPELFIKGDPKLVARVTTRIEGNTLYVATRGIFISLGKSEATRVELTLPAIEKLQFSGSGDGNIKGFKGSKLDLRMHGSGDVMLEGEFTQLQANMSGSGDLQLQLDRNDMLELNMLGSGDALLKGQGKALSARLSGSGNLNAAAFRLATLNVQSMGSGDARVSVSEEVNGRLLGSGDLFIQGNPVRRQLEKHGSGDIIWK